MDYTSLRRYWGQRTNTLRAPFSLFPCVLLVYIFFFYQGLQGVEGWTASFGVPQFDSHRIKVFSPAWCLLFAIYIFISIYQHRYIINNSFFNWSNWAIWHVIHSHDNLSLQLDITAFITLFIHLAKTFCLEQMLTWDLGIDPSSQRSSLRQRVTSQTNPPIKKNKTIKTIKSWIMGNEWNLFFKS